jgi:hypothetical protein
VSDSNHATAVTAPSRPAIAEAAVGFDPRAALAGYRSPLRGLVLLPLGGFSGPVGRVFAEMTGSPLRGYVESGRRVCRDRRSLSSQRAHRSPAPEAAPQCGATFLAARTSQLARAIRPDRPAFIAQRAQFAESKTAERPAPRLPCWIEKAKGRL